MALNTARKPGGGKGGGRKGNPRNNRAIIERRQQRVGDLYCEWKTQWQIAHILKVSQATVALDLKAIKKKWTECAVMKYGDRKAEEIAKVDHLEALALKSYHRSCRGKVSVKALEAAVEKIREDMKGKATGGIPRRANVDKLPLGPGDVFFLQLALKCIDLRCRICGLYDEVNVTNVQVNVWDQLAKGPQEDLVVIDSKVYEGLPQSPS